MRPYYTVWSLLEEWKQIVGQKRMIISNESHAAVKRRPFKGMNIREVFLHTIECQLKVGYSTSSLTYIVTH